MQALCSLYVTIDDSMSIIYLFNRYFNIDMSWMDYLRWLYFYQPIAYPHQLRIAVLSVLKYGYLRLMPRCQSTSHKK